VPIAAIMAGGFMWILFSLAGIAILLIISSVEISRHQVDHYEVHERTLPFIKSMFVQLLISAFVLVASGYLMIELDKAVEIRNNTQSTPDFFRALFDGIFYVVGLGFLAYGYRSYKNDVLDNK
jgi:hypothetical protein